MELAVAIVIIVAAFVGTMDRRTNSEDNVDTTDPVRMDRDYRETESRTTVAEEEVTSKLHVD